jgi:hypothetical protein
MDKIDLTTQDVYDVLCKILPKQNDFALSDYSEELNELQMFGIQTKAAFGELVVKHSEEVMRIDAEPLDNFHVKTYKVEYGDKFIQNKIDNQFWFAYPALLRIILELEFGEKYIEFANKRDNI